MKDCYKIRRMVLALIAGTVFTAAMTLAQSPPKPDPGGGGNAPTSPSVAIITPMSLDQDPGGGVKPKPLTLAQAPDPGGGGKPKPLTLERFP